MSDFIIESGVLTKYTGKGGTVVVPEEVKTIDPHAFDECKNIKKLILNKGLEYFDEECISSLIKKEANLARILIPSTVKKIKLAGKSGVLGGKISYSIHEENPYYFMDDDICYEVNEQGKYIVIFCQNKMLGHAVINDGTIAIADCAFALPQRNFEDSDEEELNFDFDFDYDDDSVGAFVRLQKIELPHSLERIGTNAFSKCEVLSEVIIGPSVSFIDATAFSGCKKLKKITVSPKNAYYTDADSVLFDKGIKNLIAYPEGKKAEKYELPASVETFGTAFAGVEYIKDLHLSPNIAKLVRNAFPESCKIKRLYIKNDIKDIDPCAFGEKDYGHARKDEPLEVYASADYYFTDYVQEVMKSPQVDIVVIDENDTPEIRNIKKQFVFKKVEDGLCITRCRKPSHGEKSSSTIAIPAMLGDRPIVELGPNIFNELSYAGIEIIIIPEGVKRLESAVVYGMENLKKVVFPASLEYISPNVFSDKSGKCRDIYLDRRTIYVAPTNSYAENFLKEYRPDHYDVKILTVVNGDSAESTDDIKMLAAFDIAPGDNGFTTCFKAGYMLDGFKEKIVVVPAKMNGQDVTSFDLSGIPNFVQKLIIPASVTHFVNIDYDLVFYNNGQNLRTIEIADVNPNYWSDGYAIFSKDRKTLFRFLSYVTKEYSVPAGTEVIATYAFAKCENLEKLILPESIDRIENHAFYECSKLAEIDGMEYVSEVGEKIFSGGIIGGGSIPFEQKTPILIIGSSLLRYNELSQRIVKVPEGIIKICASAFGWKNENDQVEEIVLPASVKTIESAAFCGRKQLKRINIPDGVKEIRSSTFAYCEKLERIFIPASVEKIEISAFPTYSAGGRFSEERKCALMAIEVDKDNKNYCSINGMLLSKDKTELLFIPNGVQSTGFAIPAGVTALNSGVASNNMALTELVLPDSLTTVGKSAFSHCENLEKVVFPEGLETIGEYAFSGCKKLRTIVWPKKIKSIGDSAFSETGLKELVLPDTVEHIGEEAFAKTAIKKVSLPKSVRTLGWGAFSGVPEIEVYDTIDPETKDADKGIDTVNGSPNSLVGYIGMGPANAMWDCAANHTWVNYTIVVKSAETDEIKYKVWMGADGSQRQYYCFLSSAWGHNATFAFVQLDEFFPKIRGAENKLQVAQYRLEYPYDLSDAAKAKYEAYVKKNAKKGE